MIESCRSDLRGVIVTLTETGQLTCSYLGTDPALAGIRSAELRELDYREMDAEMHALKQVIRQQTHGKELTPSAKSEDDIQVHTEVPPDLDAESQAIKLEFEDDDPIPSITVKLTLKCRSHTCNVRVYVTTPPHLAASNGIITFSTLDSSNPGITTISFFQQRALIPNSLDVQVVITYTNTMGCVRVLESAIKLPLKLIAKPCLPVKTNKFRVTIDTNKPAVNLNTVFPDLLGDNANSTSNALGFKYFGLPAVITVLASKTSQRYRLQSDDFAALWLILSELMKRLRSHMSVAGGGSTQQPALQISFNGPLPLQEYFEILDRHFESRQLYERLQGLLEERASQFRAIERRLLTRFKDRTPAPLVNLDTLLDGTYKQLLAVASAAEDNSQEQTCLSAELSAATRLLTALVGLAYGLSERDSRLLAAVFNAECKEANSMQGWEEMVDAAITHLLRTCLAKTSKDQTVNPSPMTLLKDTGKLKKHIALLCDRLSKGGRLTLGTMEKEGLTPDQSRARDEKQGLSEISERDEQESMTDESMFDEVIAHGK